MPRSQLVELYARDLGVIGEAHLEPAPGFTVITGETGAGKTLLLGALALALGLETEGARLALGPAARAVALFTRDGEEVVLAREVGSGGRLRASIDAAPASAEALRARAGELVVIHGQHDSLALRTTSAVLALIDRVGGVNTRELTAARADLARAREQRSALGGEPAERERRVEYLEFQLAEFAAVAPTGPTELESVLSELTRLTELREGQSALADVLATLDGEDDGAVLARFATALGRLPQGDVYREARATLADALTGAREAVHDLAALLDPDAVDIARLGALDERARVLGDLARKHGGTLRAALDRRDVLLAERDELDGAERRLAALDQVITATSERVAALSARVRTERENAAHALTDAVAAQLGRVALAGARVRFGVEGDDGSRAAVAFSANPGRPEGPLAALASGGELSRVLLAISLETADADAVAVFDEIDAGLGGQVAQQIGECLGELSRRQQVLAVTHLASVAARADRHFVIDKSLEAGRTTTTVRPVEGEERVSEIARMLAGEGGGEESLALARRLLDGGPTVHLNETVRH